MNEFYVIIPARYESTRLPGKVLRSIAGKPMIEHVYRAALASGAAGVWVATDDQRVAEACEKVGAECLLTGEHESGSDRIAEAAGALGLAEDAIVVNLQGDEPLMPSIAIRQAAETLSESENAELATLVAPIRRAEELHDPNVVKVVLDEQGFALYFSRAPIPWDREAFAQGARGLPEGGEYLRHIGIYAYRNRFLQELTRARPCGIERQERLEQLRALYLGARIAVSRFQGSIPAGVDVAEDIERVERILGKRQSGTRVLFVCMGNICRSPSAQGVAEKIIADRGMDDRFELDSAGTHAYHVGEPPDPRAVKTAARRGIDLSGQRARQVDVRDFHEFDYILAMDEENYRILANLRPEGAPARLHKMMEFCDAGGAGDVPDPYYGGRHGFERVLDLLENAVGGFVDRVTGGLGDRDS